MSLDRFLSVTYPYGTSGGLVPWVITPGVNVNVAVTVPEKVAVAEAVALAVAEAVAVGPPAVTVKVDVALADGSAVAVDVSLARPVEVELGAVSRVAVGSGVRGGFCVGFAAIVNAACVSIAAIEVACESAAEMGTANGEHAIIARNKTRLASANRFMRTSRGLKPARSLP